VVDGAYAVFAVDVSTGRLIPPQRALATPHLGPFDSYLPPCAERGAFGELTKAFGPSIFAHVSEMGDPRPSRR
jgi:hypothetical protein